MRRFLPLLAATILLSSCGMETLTLRSSNGDKVLHINVEVADNADERNEGLMKRTSLKDGEGMLFVFTEQQMLKFWMKDTLIPLDIMFFDGAGAFVSGTTMQPCSKDPCPQYASAAPAMYALEVPKDYRTTKGIGVGWTISPDEIRGWSKPE